ncbi:MAG: DUF4249 family protein [Candidatus Saccharibacteria bacterium]
MTLNKLHINKSGRIFLYGILLIILTAACEDIYHPELKDAINLPVIEARLTNNPAFNYIKLNKTTHFLDDFLAKDIPNAKVEVLQENGTILPAKHTVTGLYNFPYQLECGKSYKIRVTLDKETYESSWETLPPVPHIDEFHVERDTLVDIFPNTYGIPTRHYTPGFSASVDITASDSLKNYLFRYHSILQYINPKLKPMAVDTFLWTSFFHNASDNFVRPAKYSNNTLIKQHKLMFHLKDYITYIDTTIYNKARLHAYGTGWIFEIDQYGLTENAIDFYQKITDQLNAKGKLFDPIYAQIKGNITCTSNPDKVMLGLFDLCSVKRHQYFVTNIDYKNIYYHKIDPVLDIPYEGLSAGVPPFFWQYPYK